MKYKAIIWVGVAVLVAGWIGVRVYDTVVWRTFDQSAWRAAEYHDKAQLRMARDLIKREVLIGKTESDVTNLLGRPTIVDDWPKDRRTIHYSVGEVSSLGFAYLSFAIEVIPSGQVVRCELRRRNY